MRSASVRGMLENVECLIGDTELLRQQLDNLRRSMIVGLNHDLTQLESLDEAIKAIEAFRTLVTEPGTTFDEDALPEKLQVFSNIHSYPSRVKCAILAWHTLRAALEGSDEPVTTE